MEVNNRFIQSAYLHEIIYGSKWKKHYILIILIGLLAFPYCYIGLWPAWQKQADLKTQLIILEEQLKLAQRNYDNLPNDEQIIEELAVKKLKLSIFTGENNDQNSFIKTINDRLKQSGCQIENLQSLPKNNMPTMKQWKLQIQGDYFQICHFLSSLVSSSSLFIFESINIIKTNEKLHASIIINLSDSGSLAI